MGKVGDNGWVKIHRSMLSWGWFDDQKTLHVFITILLSANREDGEWHGIKVKRGQWVTGRKKLSKITGLSERQVRTALSNLKTTNELTIKTTNKFSVITVVNWDTYQIKNGKTTSETPNKPPTNDHKQEVKEVIQYLNSVTGKSYSEKAKGNIESISGRLSDGYTLADCKKVIDNKWHEWRGTEFENFVRPLTLFAPTKFDSYLNDTQHKKKNKTNSQAHGYLG
jgi:uncharacterized phage protein (TIGR02220 family)